MASFQAKTGWVWLRKKKKIIIPINSYSIKNRKLKKKIAKKIKKLKNIIMASFQAKMGRERPRKRKKKIIVPITSYLTRNRKFKKK